MSFSTPALLATLALGLAAGHASANTDAIPAEQTKNSIVLEGVLRDFKIDHPDMQYEDKSFGVRTKLVLPDLVGEIGSSKPVLNTSVDYKQGMISSVSSFNQWFRDVEGVNKRVLYPITLTETSPNSGVFFFAREYKNFDTGEVNPDPEKRYFFPLDEFGSDVCWNDKQTVSSGSHNFYFTYELRTLFTFIPRAARNDPTQDLTFNFTGDDDVWVFINGKLAVDIGGVHGQKPGAVNLDEQAAALGLEPYGVYELVLFFAERHTTQSNFRIETTIQLSTETEPLYD